MSGICFMAGNNHAMSESLGPRCLEKLREASLLIFEEAVSARRCLREAGVHRPYSLLNEHQQNDAIALARETWKNNESTLFIPDHGLPNIADPGAAITRAAIEEGAQLRFIPSGCSSTAAAAAMAPFPMVRHLHLGFLPRETNERDTVLSGYRGFKDPMIILETPYRRAALLDSLARVIRNRRIFLAFDIGNAQETYWFGQPNAAPRDEGKLPFVVIVEPLPSNDSRSSNF